MKTRQAQEIVRRAKAIGYKYSHVTSGKYGGRAATVCSSSDGSYRIYFDYYESGIEWLEMMEAPEPVAP